MKCKCGLEMELWQSIKDGNQIIKRYRCACGAEKAEWIDVDKPKYPPKKAED